MNIDTESLIARRIPIPGTFNVRDLGGYVAGDGRMLRWKTLFRGDALHRVEDEGKGLFADYGLRTCLDLREHDERSASPDRLATEMRAVSVPLFSYVAPASGPEKIINRSELGSLEDAYFGLVRQRGFAIAAAIQELLKADALPAIIHCTAGKDRTGVLVAVILAALGVPDEVIAADFTATNLFISDEFTAAVRVQTEAIGRAPLGKPMQPLQADLILRVLEDIRTSYGNVETYLLEHGMSRSELSVLRDLLLVSPV